eukprot:jgi/Picsp_1/2221/NSC_05685-R1_mutator mutt protein
MDYGIILICLIYISAIYKVGLAIDCHPSTSWLACLELHMACLRAEIGSRFILSSVVADSNSKHLILRNRVLDRKIGSSSSVRGLTQGKARVNNRIGDRSCTFGKVIGMADSGTEYQEEESKRRSPYTLPVVAVALIDSKGRVLLAQRPSDKHLHGLYEFPGGKIESRESPEAALVRELDEELGVRVQAEDLIPITFASHAYQDKGFHLLMPVYGCKWEGEEISVGAENQRLVWCHAEELDSFDMPPADYPLLPAIKRFMIQHRHK